MGMYVKIIALLGLYLVSIVAARTCEHIDQCSCRYTDTGKVVSLHAIDNAHPPPARFVGIKQASKPDFSFDYNPCTAFSSAVGKCKNQLVCQNYKLSTDSYSLANPDSIVISYDSGNLVFQYTGVPQGGYTRKTEITLKCDKTAETPTMSHPVEHGDKTDITFKFDVTTKCACEGVCSKDAPPADAEKNKLSIGSILCIILLVLVVVYFIGGIIFLKFVKKNEGTDVIPNRDFWTDFPSKVKDGCKFTYGKVRRGNQEYEAI